MAQQRQASVIRRKTRAAREGADLRVMSPVRALRLALARAADMLYDLPLVVSTVEQRGVESGEVEAVLGTDGLFVLLDGAQGMRAAMRLCPGLLAALIEMQTTGRVRPGDVRPRAPTRTDAAMVAPLVDALLAGFDDGMGEGGGDHLRRGLHFGDRVEDARALALLLAAPEFEFFRLTVDLGPGLRSGRLDLLVPPAPLAPAQMAGAAARDGPRRGRAGRREPEDVSAVALAAPVALDAVLARIRLPLRAAMALEPGGRLDIPKASLGTVRLIGAGGHVAGEGRLGRRDGWRAVRLSGPQAEARPDGAPPAVAPPRPAAPGTAGPKMAAPDPAAEKPGAVAEDMAEGAAEGAARTGPDTGAEQGAETGAGAALAPLSD